MPGSRLRIYRAGSAKITRRAGAGRAARSQTRIVIDASTSDPAAVSLAIREWIVPVLVREFLAERAAKAALLTTMNMQKLDTEPLGKEQRANPATSQ